MTTTSSTSSTTTQLDSTYTTLISAQIEQESAPLTRLEEKADELELLQAVYTDLNSKLASLQTTSKSLLSTDPFYTLKAGRAVATTPSDSDKTVASASVSSSAVPGSYEITDIVLAKNDKVRSAQQEYSDQALSLTGTFYIGGAETTSAEMVAGSDNAVSSIELSDVENGQLELGTDTYYVETRKNSLGVWQFRLVDSEGNAVKIKVDDDNYTSNWQSIPTDGDGTYDTGRGLTINFGTDAEQYVAKSKATGSTAINYETKGAEIEVTSDMSLVDIADAINSGTYGDGNGVSASVVNNMLVISNDETGSKHQLVASGTVLEKLGVLSGTAFADVVQTASDASFKIDDTTVTRSSNTALTDVIQGVTLNLASDAEGESATINITADNSSARTTIDSFITNFNALQEYLTTKTTNSKNDDGTYTRGDLTGDQTINSLRYSLQSLFSKYDSTGGTYKSMQEIGIEVSDSQISITDESALTDALASNYDEVMDLFDRVMKDINDTLSKYTGKSSSYVNQMIAATEDQVESTNDQIETWNERIAKREAYLTSQYVEIQSQMTLLSYQSSSSTAWINTISSLYS